MNQQQFVAEAEPRWQRLGQMLGKLEREGRRAKLEQGRQLPALYRSVCRDLSLARERGFDAHVLARLNALALRGHQQLYATRRFDWTRVFRFWLDSFPSAVRRQRSMVALCTLLFVGSGLAMALTVIHRPHLIHSVMGQKQVTQLEQMYDPSSKHHLRPRGRETDVAMFGFYVWNNISIGFRTFATGVFAGLGSLFFVLFNGVHLGAVIGHLHNVGFGHTLGTFIVGHSALELTAIVLCGAAGMRLGFSLVAPGPYARAYALKQAALAALPIVYGAAGMLLVAACVEAFWSSSALLAAWVKYLAGGLLWCTVVLYFLLVGPEREAGRRGT